MYCRVVIATVCVSWMLTCASVALAEDYVTEADVSYYGDAPPDQYARSRCRLDICCPKDKQDYATVVWFHGGGLRAGSRETGASLAARFTAAGVGVVLVDYRLSPQAKCPAYIEDAAAAVAWTVKNIVKYRGDPHKVFVSGHSAGGYLTAMVGCDPRYLARHGLALEDMAGLLPVSGQMITHSTIRDERGISELTPLIDRFAPAHHASKETPPCLCIVGNQDLPARLEENLYAAAAFRAAGHERFQCMVFQNRDHGTIISQVAAPDDEVAEAMLAFIRREGAVKR